MAGVNSPAFMNRKYREYKMMLCHRRQRRPPNLAWKFSKVREEFILLSTSVWLRFFADDYCEKLNNLHANNLFHSEKFSLVDLVAHQNVFLTEIEELKKCLRKFHMVARKQDGPFYNKLTLTSIRVTISCGSFTNCTFNFHFKWTSKTLIERWKCFNNFPFRLLI